MNELGVGITYGLAACATAYGLLKAIPAVLLSDWAEDKMRRHALRARAHLEALAAARQAYESVIVRDQDDSG